MKHIILSILTLAIALGSMAGDFQIDPRRAASQYQAYPDTALPALTPAPAGYRPFHIEHYGRHGSRWLTSGKSYDVPVDQLTKAERAGVLTPLGVRLLAELRTLREDSRGRIGELTPLGAAQHRGIARRMASNFPEVINDSSFIDARSTVVIRCILSMLNETNELHAAAPGAIITTDASQRDMHYMNFHDKVRNELADTARSRVLNPFAKRHCGDGSFLKRLITDPQFATDSIDRNGLWHALMEVAANMQSHPNRQPFLTDVFSPEEITEAWKTNNASWLITGGNTALTNGRSALVQRHLLRNMIASADTAAASPRPSANLRFGHETMVLSLAVLLELADYGVEQNDLETLHNYWRASDIFPMACNIQMVFYRPEKSAVCQPDEMLVKILLNEHEMPVSFATPVSGPYYRWSDIKPHLLTTISR